MKPELSIPRMTRAELETESEANRLIDQIKGALVSMSVRALDEVDSLDQAADRIERASRDLAFALRELAQEQRKSEYETQYK